MGLVLDLKSNWYIRDTFSFLVELSLTLCFFRAFLLIATEVCSLNSPRIEGQRHGELYQQQWGCGA